MRMLVAVLVYLSTLLPVWAEDVVAGFSQDSISITTNFSGSEILIFGAVRREAPIARDTDLEVVVTVAGPQIFFIRVSFKNCFKDTRFKFLSFKA